MQRIIDLDASGVLTEPIIATIHGTDYLLPGDIPTTLYVRLTAVRDREGTSVGQVAQELHEELLALFRTHQPDLERIPLGMGELVHAVSYIYGGGADAAADGEEDATDPTPPAKKAPARKRSRSST